MKYCRTCGAELNDAAVICPKCGCPTSIYVKKNVNPIPFLIAYAVSILVVFVAVVGGMYGDSTTAVYSTLTGGTVLNLLMVFFALTVSIYLYMNYSLTDKKAMGSLIVVGAILFVGFCIAAKNLSALASQVGEIKNPSEDTKKMINNLLTISSFIMLGHMFASILAIVTGSLGIAGKFRDIQPKVEIEELEEIEE